VGVLAGGQAGALLIIVSEFGGPVGDNSVLWLSFAQQKAMRISHQLLALISLKAIDCS
jgi:hypothetical protein